jgi:hypothetical protein
MHIFGTSSKVINYIVWFHNVCWKCTALHLGWHYSKANQFSCFVFLLYFLNHFSHDIACGKATSRIEELEALKAITFFDLSCNIVHYSCLIFLFVPKLNILEFGLKDAFKRSSKCIMSFASVASWQPFDAIVTNIIEHQQSSRLVNLISLLIENCVVSFIIIEDTWICVHSASAIDSMFNLVELPNGFTHVHSTLACVN